MNCSNGVIEKICPLPKSVRSEPKRKRLSKESEIITATPFKDSLVNTEPNKKAIVEKTKRKITGVAKNKKESNKKLLREESLVAFARLATRRTMTPPKQI